jgi:hypothetical protein
MSSIDTLLSWLDEALVDAEIALKTERAGFQLLASEFDDGRRPWDTRSSVS